MVGGYMRHYMGRNFHAVRLSKAIAARLPPKQPAIVYTNHPSWWDPALFIVLQTAVFAGRPGYGPMNAAALERYRFMRRIGIFGIEPGTRRGAAKFLRTALKILSDTNAVLWITSEGGFTDPRKRPVQLEPGIAHLVRRVEHVVIVPLAIEYPFWDERYPEALCRFGEGLSTDNSRARSVKTWKGELEARLTETMDALGEEAKTRDPRLFDSVVKGAVGIGGVYDMWRRARALVLGRRFRPQHGDQEG
jgi:1-acyl-sn-glycerol-3-phosphate acyltransferase